MRFISVCSGIEAASVAAKPLGWRTVAFSEIEPFPCALLAHHYPDTPNWGDMTKFKEWPDVSIDLLCGGTPCQSFSVAGLRKGLDDPRGNLMLTFGAIAAKYRPKWLVWENVPGVLSSNEGRDFGAFLGMLGQLGYGFAYRVLDAQYFGVAQRRRRVFVVGCLGDWRSAAAVLFERHSLQGHPAPSRSAGQEATATIRAGASNGGPAGHGARSGDSKDELIVPVAWPADVASTLDAHFVDKMGLENQHINAGAPLYVPAMAFAENSRNELRLEGGDGKPGQGALMVAFSAQDNGRDATELIAPTMRKGGDGGGVQLAVAVSLRGREGGATAELGGDLQNCLRASNGGGDKPHVLTAMQVRRLTPEECEALQGFPRGYTAVPHRGKPAADGPRYKALGNSWAVPNVRWIFQRIDLVSNIKQMSEAA